jgi:phosphatidylinositol glycan class M
LQICKLKLTLLFIYIIRSTYRYPPLIAFLLIPNHYLFKEFGKLIFSLADVGVIYMIYEILNNNNNNNNESSSTTTTTFINKNKLSICHISSWLWVINPLAINISTRGSADSITNLLILYMVLLIYQNKIIKSSIIYGILVHLRIYPVIYLLSIVIFILDIDFIQIKNYIFAINNNNNNNNNNNIKSLISRLYMIILFISITVITIIILTYISYYFYGIDFLDNAILYHLTRKDHRHNFSPFHYFIYLGFGNKNEYFSNYLSYINDNNCSKYYRYFIEIIIKLVDLYNSNPVIHIIPQILLILGIEIYLFTI